MSNEREDVERSPLDTVSEWYESLLALRVGAVALAPFTHGISAIADQAIVSTFAFLKRSRIRAFRNELTLLNLHLTEEDVQSREFIEGFIAAAGKAENATREEKIRLFARLFRSYWQSGRFTPEAFDEYEEDLAIVDELSYREFMLLSILHRLETQHPLQPGMNKLQRARKFWAELEREAGELFGVPTQEVEGLLQRLSRTGLYQPITGAFLDYTGGLGHLTPRFERIRRRLDGSDPNSQAGS
jgi:hypothetical protein